MMIHPFRYAETLSKKVQRNVTLVLPSMMVLTEDVTRIAHLLYDAEMEKRTEQNSATATR